MKMTKCYFFDLKKFFKRFASSVLLLFVMLLLTNFSFVNAVSADWLETVNKGGLETVGEVYGQPSANSGSLILTIASIIKVSLGFLGIIFLVLLIWSGFNWMTAGGEEEKVTKATDTIQRAVIGLIIILASFAITSFVINKIISSTP
ncbi:MAG: hypothetical protein V1649_01590 [Patescibacteria group bacterium]